jgi:flagellar assembly protein FliH
MSSAVIPKEQMSAYQRWEMASFNEPAPQLHAPERPSIEEIAEIREAARATGHTEGWADGRAAGLAQGRAEAAEELQRLRQIADTFGSEVARADEIIAQQMLELALDLAKAVLKTALTVRPELVLPIVAEAVHYLPALQQPALLFLHPDDAQLVRQHMGDELQSAGWRVAEEPQMEPGGCRVETASNQIDASVPSRWQRVATALGHESEWLAP